MAEPNKPPSDKLEPSKPESSKQWPAVIDSSGSSSRVTQAILDFVSHIPASKVGNSTHPEVEARRLASRAAQRAALTAGSLALPPGPLGWLTVLPELIAIWKIQAQMVSDIAAAYGKHSELGREQMLWCLFRHTTAQAFRDLVVRMGDRLLFRRMSYSVVERIAKQIGMKITRRAIGEGVSRWLPMIGALGVGAYAYYDTGQVAATTIAMMNGEFEMAETGAEEVVAIPPPRKPSAMRRVIDKATTRKRGKPHAD
ncbi:MAG: hypothetical protein WA777_11020 [Rhodanobacter sp.]